MLEQLKKARGELRGRVEKVREQREIMGEMVALREEHIMVYREISRSSVLLWGSPLEVPGMPL